MSSGWIINYKDGTSMILSEEKYKALGKQEIGKFIQSEEHWFDIKEAIKKHPWIEVYE
jgi:hypothetical protein